MPQLCALTKKEMTICSTLFLVSLPLLSVLGTQLVNFYQNNVILLILLFLIALVPALIAFDKFIPERLYPLAIVMVAIALLFYTSLISTYLIGADIHQEYYFANLVKNESSWDSAIPNDFNAMLSIVMLAPICSIVCGMSLTWVFKIIYPLLFSLVPLVLYRIYERETNSKVAFFGVFFFMSVFTFFIEMLSLARQQIAELFLGLLMLLIVSKNMNPRKRATLLIVFSASLVVSHYGTSYIFMFCLISSLFILLIMERIRGALKNRTINGVFVSLYILLAVSWYIYVSGSAPFNVIISVADNIARNFFTNFLNPESAQGLNILIRETASPIHTVYKGLHILMQFFIAIGIFSLVLRLAKKKSKIDYEFSSLSLVSFFLCLVAIAVPYLASSLNTTRLYHLTLFFLAPFSVLGAVDLFNFLSRMWRSISAKRSAITMKTSLKALSVILGIFLLFNTGFVYEITKDHSDSISLSQNWIKECGNAKEKFALYSSCTPVEEVVSAVWLSRYRNGALDVYSDYRARNNVLNSYAMISRSEGHALEAGGSTTIVIKDNSYVYLRKSNIFDGIMGGSPQLIGTGIPNTFNATQILSLMPQKANKVYSNGGSEIFYTIELIRLELKKE
jgi:uncharacterized membrane protein